MVDVDNGYDGIWYNDVVLTGTVGTKRIPAWTFRNDQGLPSPGFTLRTETSAGRPMGVNQRIELQVVGAQVTAPDGSTSVVPAGASAVALNMTAVGPAAPGFMTVWPCDVGRPDASNLNFGPFVSVVANSVIAPIGASGKVCFYTNQSSHLLVDISGWFAGDGRRTDVRRCDPEPGARHSQRHRRPQGTPPGGRHDLGPVGRRGDATHQRRTRCHPGRRHRGRLERHGGESLPGRLLHRLAVWHTDARGVQPQLHTRRRGRQRGGRFARRRWRGVHLNSNQQSDVLVDVLGWFSGGAGQPPYTGGVPQRLVDTRNAIGDPRA